VGLDVIVLRSAFLALLIIVAAQAQESGKTKHATISGTVTDAATKQPIVKAVLTLRDVSARYDDSKSSQTTTTDTAGRYEIHDVAAGEYDLRANKPGYLSADYAVGTGKHRRSTNIAVTDGKDFTGMDLAMKRGGVISGRVLNEDGEPFPEVQVTAYHYGRMERGGKPRLLPWSRPVQTDDRGEYRIFDLDPAQYYVACAIQLTFNPNEIDKNIKRAYPKTFYPAATSADAATPIMVTAGGEAVANFALTTAPAFTVKGKIVGATEQIPVIVTLNEPDLVFYAPQVGRMSKGDTFELPGVLPGTYQLTAQQSPRSGEEPRFVTRKITVADTDLQDVTLSLNAPYQPTPGSIQILGDQKIDPSTLYLYLSSPAFAEDEDSSFALAAGRFTQPRKDGSFTFSVIQPEGKFFVNVGAQRNELEDWYTKSVFFAGRDVTDTGFSPAPGGSLQVFLSPNGATVEGVVVDKDGKPVPGAEVTTVPEEAHRQRRDLYQSGSTNQLGHFRIRGISPGSYKLLAVEDDETQSVFDTDFLKAHLASGTDLKVEEKGKYNVSVTIIPAEPEDATK